MLEIQVQIFFDVLFVQVWFVVQGHGISYFLSRRNAADPKCLNMLAIEVVDGFSGLW